MKYMELAGLKCPERVHVEMKQRTPEWFDARKGKITGTNYDKIISQTSTRSELLRIKALERLNNCVDMRIFQPSKHMLRGIELEPVARRTYMKKTNQNVLEVGFVDYLGNNDKFLSYCGCSPDGLVGRDGMIEIKCPADENFEKQKNIPKHYYRQIQYNLWCTERKWCDYVLYNREAGIYVERIHASLDDSLEIRNVINLAIFDIEKMMATCECNEMEAVTADLPF